MTIDVTNRSGSLVPAVGVEKLLTFAIDFMELHPDCELSVTFVADNEMEELADRDVRDLPVDDPVFRLLALRAARPGQESILAASRGGRGLDSRTGRYGRAHQDVALLLWLAVLFERADDHPRIQGVAHAIRERVLRQPVRRGHRRIAQPAGHDHD